MKLQEIVHSDPEILSGTPVFVGSRVPVQSLFDYLEGGETLTNSCTNSRPSSASRHSPRLR